MVVGSVGFVLVVVGSGPYILGGGSWWWLVVRYILGGGGWWWMVMGSGMVYKSPLHPFSWIYKF